MFVEQTENLKTKIFDENTKVIVIDGVTICDGVTIFDVWFERHIALAKSDKLLITCLHLFHVRCNMWLLEEFIISCKHLKTFEFEAYPSFRYSLSKMLEALSKSPTIQHVTIGSIDIMGIRVVRNAQSLIASNKNITHFHIKGKIYLPMNFNKLLHEFDKEIEKNWTIRHFVIGHLNYSDITNRNIKAHTNAKETIVTFLIICKRRYGKDVAFLVASYLWQTRTEPNIWIKQTFFDKLKKLFKF